MLSFLASYRHLASCSKGFQAISFDDMPFFIESINLKVQDEASYQGCAKGGFGKENDLVCW